MNARVLTGKGIHVAVLDTGIYPHIDFAGRILKFADFVHYKSHAYDENGHGTHVCGILAGSGRGCQYRYQGCAPECGLVVAKVLDQYGNGKKEVILRSFQWLLHEYQRLDVRIVNISVGTTCNFWREQKSLVEGVDALWDAGLVVVAAAGNQGPTPGSVTAPGSSNKIITVGCSDMLTAHRDASGRGPTEECVCKPDVVAPGYQVMSCIPYYDGKPAYGKKSGTSMSTPYVSGSIAQMLQKDPMLTNVEIKMMLRDSARDMGYPQNVQGWGLFDRERFLNF